MSSTRIFIALALFVLLPFVTACNTRPMAPANVHTGLDHLVAHEFAPLRGQRIGLITNHSGIDRHGRHILDLMSSSKSVDLVAIFSPEHGIRGHADERVGDGIDEATGLPVFSLYGETRRPTPEMLEGVDTLVFDIQDIGARFYTYIATMGGCMEVAAQLGIKVVVLDRPNPLGATRFDGPIQDDELVGRFIAFRPMPITHGMTVGEIALFFNNGGDNFTGIACDLEVIQVTGWSRAMRFDQTGLPWVNPSPNMRSLDEELLYTMVALTEGNKDVSVGRGTDRPFEYLGAPWIDGRELTQAMNASKIPGLWAMQTTFIPSAIDITGRENYPYQFIGEVCHGTRLVVTDRDAFEPVVAGVHMLDVLMRLYPERYSVEKLRNLVGAQWVLDAIERGEDPEAIIDRWRSSEAFQSFARQRKAVLLYD